MSTRGNATRRRGGATTGAALLLAGTMAITGCAAQEQATPLPPAPSSPSPSPSEPGDSAAPAEPVPAPAPDPGPVQPVGEPIQVATGLETPWSLAPLDSGSVLISERDTGRILERTAAGDLREVGVIADTVPGGEGGLLGLDTLVDGDTTWLYAFHTSASDNRIVRMPLQGAAGALTLGASENVLTGIVKAGNHNGGRIAFGPDGMLYATTGDASIRTSSQDPASLNGKILRMTPAGAAPDDNPTAGSLVYSLGHRNPQGIAWDDDGQLWAAEFGQNTWDEFNRIEPGANYGWPVVEGVSDDPAYVNPAAQWSTAEASPSGLAHVRGTFFLASLRGQRVWAIYDGGATTVPWFQQTYGRIRDVAAGPDGTLWVLTSNTDGNGSPRDGDDQVIQVQLAPVQGR
ncbi:PQQ-dependent sugar dehydrogenase [Marisediminicola senii]|uniref:PQQ-dependent sugar dehydrogenase n=1 Tax=Marisediminicola senii TaxID=2711233 RepID=UPI0013EA125B|nr:PQQ-dependent sugar dehydrogenase [Marisediminicola senii]